MTDVIKQGVHPDPAVTVGPAASEMTPLQRRVMAHPATKSLGSCLELPGEPDLRSAVLSELAEYHGITAERALERCIEWEAESVSEWEAGDRSTDEGIREFYTSVQSWSFDLLWYALLQATGLSYPVQPLVAVASGTPRKGARHLDFGSGAGTLSQLFEQLGYESDAADVSRTLLEFAKYRIDRRKSSVRFLDLNHDSIPEREYDVITAIDTLVHVPNLEEAAVALHKALKPGGLLFANFDVRPPSPENGWHLYSDDLPLRWTLQRVGFEPVRSYDGYVTKYRRVENSGFGGAWRGARDWVMLRSPLRPSVRRARTAARRFLVRS